MKLTLDGGYIMVGYSCSSDGDVASNYGSSDVWISKHDANGNLEWEKNFGGTYYDGGSRINLTSDGGYIIVGESYSDNGDFTEHKGELDACVIKIDNMGNKQWAKTIGGNKHDYFYDIMQTLDGGYIAVGATHSETGDITNAVHGNKSDALVVKMDANGNIIWKKSFGGSNNEEAMRVKQTIDGGYLIAGIEASSDGDVSNHIGDHFNLWLFKIDASGNLSWDKSFGNKFTHDFVYDFQTTNDGGYIFGGTEGLGLSHYRDGAVTKIDKNGVEQWKYKIEGNEDSSVRSITQTSDDGYFVVAESSLTNLGIDNNGKKDIIAIKLDSVGNEQWKVNIGGSNNDIGSTGIELADGNFMIAGFTSSNDKDVHMNHGASDRWLVKISPPTALSCTYPIALDDILDGNTLLEFNDVKMIFEDKNSTHLQQISIDYSISEVSDGLHLQIGANAGETMEIYIDDMRPESLGFKDDLPCVIPIEKAGVSLTLSDEVINKISSQRAKLGAKQNALEHLINSVNCTSENLQASESRIRDVDMAKEMMELAKHNILQEVENTMLTQSNQIPQMVLKLLK